MWPVKYHKDEVDEVDMIEFIRNVVTSIRESSCGFCGAQLTLYVCLKVNKVTICLKPSFLISRQRDDEL